MDKRKNLRGVFLVLFITTFIFIFFTYVRTRIFNLIPLPRGLLNPDSPEVSDQTITRVVNTKHLLVSAFMDQMKSTATDVMCQIPQSCDAAHVALLTQPDHVKDLNQRWLPIRNKLRAKKENEFEFDFTVCVSNLFGGYNNVLQFAQTLEMYSSDVMERAKYSMDAKYLLLFIIVFLLISFAFERMASNHWTFLPPYKSMNFCSNISDQTITPLDNTKHFLVSAFMDQRVKGFDIRIISIFRRDSIQPLHCLFCCADHLSNTTPATVLVHSDHFGFAYGTTDVMCQIPHDCRATHVTLVPDTAKPTNLMWLPLRNKETHEKNKRFEFNFTVCISTLFGGYNNVLQFAQTLEIYRLLGVGRVVVYNNSGGPELSRLLHSYSQEGLVELVQWPIHNYLNPSHGWHSSVFEGDLQYYGQVVALNECIYRSMQRSRYVLLNDIDEIIMPYQHDTLTSLMDTLQQQHPNTGVFIIQAVVYPKKTTEESNKGYVDAWSHVPGFNILQRIYWANRNEGDYHPHKMLIQPSFVEQTSVHEVLKLFGDKYKIPEQLCHIIHSVTNRPTERPLKELHLDKRLWDFKDRVIPRVTEMLRRAGLLSSEEEADG